MRDLALLLVILVAVFSFLVAGSMALHQYLVEQAQQQLSHSLRHICHQNPAMC